MVGTAQRHRIRWIRGLSRAVFLVVGAVQCLLGVIFGVSLLASALIYAGDGPGLDLTSILLLVLDLTLFVAGLFALVSALQDWDPPYNRWRGVRWPLLGLGGTVLTMLSWIVAAAVIWAI